MRLTDVMSNLGLGIYPILALPLFIGVFVGVVLRVSKRSRRAELQRAGDLPLEEGECLVSEPAGRGAGGTTQ
jgi:cbb3-type cytochrome oxidase subunit 3